jgi:hypothetical protein
VAGIGDAVQCRQGAALPTFDYRVAGSPSREELGRIFTYLPGGVCRYFGVAIPHATRSDAMHSLISTPYLVVALLGDTVVVHLLAGRITIPQYLQLGQEYGYLSDITMYLCSSTWTNSPTCAPLS